MSILLFLYIIIPYNIFPQHLILGVDFTTHQDMCARLRSIGATMRHPECPDREDALLYDTMAEISKSNIQQIDACVGVTGTQQVTSGTSQSDVLNTLTSNALTLPRLTMFQAPRLA